MANSGSGGSGAASSSYGSSANGGYTNSATSGYRGNGRGVYGTAKGLYGMSGGSCDGIGTGYGKLRLEKSYLKKVDSLLGVKEKYSLKQILKGFSSEKLKYFCEPDIYRNRMSLDQRLKSCPFCGGDSLVCGCRN